MRALDKVMLLLLLLFSASALQAKCQPHIVSVTNADSSQFQSRTVACDAIEEGSSEQNTVSIYYISKPGAKASLLQSFELNVDGDAPFGSVGFEDVDKDGFHEIEQRGMCGAGPNCEGNIYKFDTKSKKLYHFFSGGYSHLLFIDGHLVEAGRASCCAWEFHAYKVRPDKKLLEYDTMTFMVDVRASGDDSGEIKAVECEFKRSVKGEWKTIRPPSKKWLVICEHYGEAYTVVKPGR
jgi:hypothetical protein